MRNSGPQEEESPALLATSKSKLPLNDISRILADNDQDHKTTTSNHNGREEKEEEQTDDQEGRILIRTILRKKKKTTKSKRMGRRLSTQNNPNVNALDRHPEKGTTATTGQGKMTKVKIYRRKAGLVVDKKRKEETQRKKKKKVLFKRKLQKIIETSVELKTRPRTYTYFVTRKIGEGGSDEFVSSSTEVRDFTYPVTVSMTVYRTEHPHQVVTSVVPTF